MMEKGDVRRDLCRKMFAAWCPQAEQGYTLRALHSRNKQCTSEQGRPVEGNEVRELLGPSVHEGFQKRRKKKKIEVSENQAQPMQHSLSPPVPIAPGFGEHLSCSCLCITSLVCSEPT